jgi:hypothetical protein
LRLQIWTIAAATVIATGAAHASLADYLTARKACPPHRGLTLAAAQAKPGTYHNCVLELKGIVSGVSRSENGSNLLLHVSDSVSVLLQGSREATLPTSGESIRALVTVQDNGDLSLLSLVTDTEVGDRQIDPPAPAPARPSKKKAHATAFIAGSAYPTKWPVPYRSRQTLSSRTGLTDAELGLYTQVIEKFNPRLSPAQAGLIARSVVESSYQRGVDARLIMAIFATESGFKPYARSRHGAMGLGQLMPGTARSLGVSNAWDPVQNIQGAVRLIQQNWGSYAAKTSDFRRVFQLVCASYNAGPNAVKKYGGVPPYRETRNYVKKVATWYRKFAPELFQS